MMIKTGEATICTSSLVDDGRAVGLETQDGIFDQSLEVSNHATKGLNRLGTIPELGNPEK
jgi:hypothetical protein